MKFKTLLIVVSVGACLNLSFMQEKEQVVKVIDRIHFEPSCNCYVKEGYIGSRLAWSDQYKDATCYERDGKSVFFFDNGDTGSVSHYKDGAAEGSFRNYYQNERLFTSGQYTGGRESGLWRRYTETGILYEEQLYSGADNGNNVITYYDTITGGKIYSEVLSYGYEVVKTTIYDQQLYDQMIWRKENRTGKQIFANCASCHHPYKDATGPKLSGVMKRRSEAWVRSWITNSSKMIASGDKTAVALYEQWHKTVMTSFPMSEKEMNTLIAYLKTL